MNFKWLLWLISMNVSCYYWRPLEVYTPNSNPEILFSDPAEGEPMQLRVSQINSAFVVVQDLDMIRKCVYHIFLLELLAQISL